MANAIFTEFPGIASNVGAAPIPAAVGPAIASNAVAIGGVSAQSPVFNATTRLVRVYAEADCTVAIGVNPTATASTFIPLAAGQYDYFVTTGGERGAVISRTVS